MVKGNDGKATRHSLAIQFLAVLGIAVIAVAGIRAFSNGSNEWHAKSARHEEQRHGDQSNDNAKLNLKVMTDIHKTPNVADITVAKDAGSKDIEDKNLIQFVFSNLDGEEGREGEVVVKLKPEWAPLGVQRIKELTTDKFWDEIRVFRALKNFMVQMGISGDPNIQKKWRNKNIKDDPVVASNARGTVTFAMAGPGTRTTQIFFNTVNNARLDPEKFAPVGEVIRYSIVGYILCKFIQMIYLMKVSYSSQTICVLYTKWNGCN